MSKMENVEKKQNMNRKRKIPVVQTEVCVRHAFVA